MDVHDDGVARARAQVHARVAAAQVVGRPHLPEVGAGFLEELVDVREELAAVLELAGADQRRVPVEEGAVE